MPMATPEEQREYQRQWMAARRKSWFDANGPCVQCGSWENLELDHIDPTQKVTHNVWSFSKERRDAELVKCQVLCDVCHETKTRTTSKAFSKEPPEVTTSSQIRTRLK